MRKTILVLLLTITLSANSQNHYIGFKISANWNNIETNLNVETDYNLGLLAGLTYDYFISDLFSISSELVYFERGYKYSRYEITSIDQSGQPNYVDVKITYNYNYVSIPLKICLNTDLIFVNIGVVTSYLLSSTIKTEYPNVTHTRKNNENINKFDLSGIVDLGITSNITDNMLLYTSFSYHRSFISVGDFENINYGLLWSVGVKYNLTK